MRPSRDPRLIVVALANQPKSFAGFCRPVLRRVFRCRIFRGRRIGLLGVVRRLLRRLQFVHDLLQRNNICFQRVDLTVGRVEFLLMVQSQLRDRLLKELDIALKATGAPFHRLLGGANLDAGNILRMGGARAEPEEQQAADETAEPLPRSYPQ